MPVTTPVVPEDRSISTQLATTDADGADLGAIWCDLGGSD